MELRPTPSARRAARSLAAAWAAVLGIGVPGSLQAGEWHRHNTLACSDCHTMHNSAGGQPMRYDNVTAPADRLMRSGTVTDLCLACHSGRPNVPSVMAPTDFDPPGGGFQADYANPARLAHSLETGPTVPPGGTDPVRMNCVTCHDPHGNQRYRNLRPSPTGTGRGESTPLVVDQGVTANGSNAAEVYLRSNVTYRSGMSAFCMDCHDQMAGTHMPTVALSSDPLLDLNRWINTPVTNRVPVQSPTDAVVPSADDQVFCLSCHKAHGTPHTGMELWVDGEGGTFDATCAQCHG